MTLSLINAVIAVCTLDSHYKELASSLFDSGVDQITLSAAEFESDCKSLGVLGLLNFDTLSCDYNKEINDDLASRLDCAMQDKIDAEVWIAEQQPCSWDEQ